MKTVAEKSNRRQKSKAAPTALSQKKYIESEEKKIVDNRKLSAPHNSLISKK